MSDIERLRMSSEDNFTCFAIACVDIIKLPLIDILTDCIKPVNLCNELRKSSSLTTGKNKLLQDQLKKCFPPTPDPPKYKDFDVSLLYTLIRNLCPSLKPTQGWGTEPKNADTQVGDDIERLRLFRNNYYGHAESTKLPDGEFEDLWKKLKSVIQRLQVYTKKWSTTNYEEELEQIEKKRFTSEDREKYKYFLEVTLNLWKHAEGRDDPVVSLRGTKEIICGDIARFELEVKQAEPSIYKVTWFKEKGMTAKQIETRDEKFKVSSDGRLIINVVCKEDEGHYYADLSRESNGITFKISSNKIHLLPLGGILFFSRRAEG